MYRAIVAHRVRVAWRHLQNRNSEFILGQLAPQFEHTFAGMHALGGSRHTRESQRAWFQRLFRLLPDFRFELIDVLVAGWPWRTRATAWVQVDGFQGGAPYRNLVAQAIELRWGRIVRVDNLEDTQLLASLLEQLRAEGVEEAGAAPIDDGARSRPGIRLTGLGQTRN